MYNITDLLVDYPAISKSVNFYYLISKYVAQYRQGNSTDRFLTSFVNDVVKEGGNRTVYAFTLSSFSILLIKYMKEHPSKVDKSVHDNIKRIVNNIYTLKMNGTNIEYVILTMAKVILPGVSPIIIYGDLAINDTDIRNINDPNRGSVFATPSINFLECLLENMEDTKRGCEYRKFGYYYDIAKNLILIITNKMVDYELSHFRIEIEFSTRIDESDTENRNLNSAIGIASAILSSIYR